MSDKFADIWHSLLIKEQERNTALINGIAYEVNEAIKRNDFDTARRLLALVGL